MKLIMQRMLKWLLTFLCSAIGGGIGESLGHGNWLSFPSILLSIVGFGVGLWLARKIDDFIEI